MVNRQTLSDQVFEAIREAILGGAFAPGQRLSEPELAKWLNVSLTPVREALNPLAATGLVVRGGRQGTYVRTLGIRDVENLLAVRESLEVLAIRQGVPRFTESDDDHLKALLHAQARATDEVVARPRSVVPQLAELNESFHQRILDRAANEWLTSMLASIQDLLIFARARLRKEATLERRRESLEEHRRILESIRRRDVDAASDRMREHIANLKAYITPLVPSGAAESRAGVDAAPFGDADPDLSGAKRPSRSKGGEAGRNRNDLA